MSYWCALVLDGVGDSDGIFAFSLGDADLTPFGYRNVPLLTNYPQNLSARLDPIKVEYDLSGFTFALKAAAPWLSLFARRIHFAEGALITAIDNNDTTLEIAYTGAFSAGEYVYLGRETILLGTLSSSSSYEDPITGQTVSYDVFTGCTRGALGSTAEAHYVSEDDDNRVYAYPELAGRLVEFWERSEGDEAASVVWRGIVSDIRIEDEDESLVLVDCSDLLSLLTSRTLNRRPYQGSAAEDVVGFAQGQLPRWLWFSAKLDEDTAAARVRFGKTSGSGGSRLALQVGTALVTGTITQQDGATDADSWFGYSSVFGAFADERSYTQLGSDLDGDAEAEGSKNVRADKGLKVSEVLCFGQDFVDTYGNYYGCGQNYTTRHHPLHLLLLVLLSTGRTNQNGLFWDKLGQEWGLGVPAALVDVAGIEAEMARTPDLKVDRLVLGWDQQAWTMRDLIDKCLRPLGYYLTRVDGGRIGVDRVRPLDVTTATNLSWSDVLEFSERLNRRMESSSQKIRASFGLPWGEQSSVTFENRGKQGRLWWPESSDVGADFDLSAFAEPDNFGKSALSIQLEWVLQLMWRPIPTQHFTIKGKASDALWPGVQIALVDVFSPPNSDGSQGVLVGKDGARTLDTLVGLIVEAEYSAQDSTWTLGAWLQNEPLRGEVVKIPPAAAITGYDVNTGALTITRVAQDVDLLDYVVIGTRWMLCDQYLVPRAWAAPSYTYLTVSSVTAGTSTLTVLFSEGLSNAVPTTGDVLRWAEYVANSDQANWLYGADDTPKLGAADPPKWYV